MMGESGNAKSSALGVLAALLALSNTASAFTLHPCPVLAHARQASRASSQSALRLGRARMSSVVAGGGIGREPPKPLPKYTTEAVGTNIPKADSAR